MYEIVYDDKGCIKRKLNQEMDAKMQKNNKYKTNLN